MVIHPAKVLELDPVVLLFVVAPYVAAVLVVVFSTQGIVSAFRAQRSRNDRGDRKRLPPTLAPSSAQASKPSPAGHFLAS